MSAAVVEEGERLSALIDKLFDLSRLQAGRLEPRRESVSIEEVLLAAEDGLPAARGHLQLVVDPATPPLVADAAQLERVFANLIENALRYSGDQPVRVSVRQLGTRVVVRVTDRGPGIPERERERVFEPFYRATDAQQDARLRPRSRDCEGLCRGKRRRDRGRVAAGAGDEPGRELPGRRREPPRRR